MKRLSLKEILEKYSSGKCTQEEKAWVEDWYAKQHVSSELPVSDSEFEKDIQRIYNRLPKEERNLVRKSGLLKIAAVFIGGVLAIGVLLFASKGVRDKVPDFQYAYSHDLEPGANKATLRLSDGSIILLDDLKVGEEYQHRDFQIRKSENGQIEYLNSSVKELTGEDFGDSHLQNEISTPKGGQYQVILPDGSKVWLNASSTLKYPSSFNSDERKVELSGEAFFEVEKQDAPFYVQTDKQRIEVLGTHFNVNAYADEKETKTTLLEGSVKVVAQFNGRDGSKASDLLLKPGEQAVLKGRDIKMMKVDVSQALAWKNGFFSFQGTDIESVMREFSRWYGVEVEFDGKLPDTKLWGEVYRNVNASQALQVLEYFDLKFEIINEKGVSKIEISEK